ncbi:NTE family protein [Desulfacinum hydrothermale DSM 13146]|uniref:NTE family protein n=1 Tax=Desulfacinum hydrothermale DSM 13146 TaxID=1121390 RepID=A0A1W1XG44_9BACT|nr:patatin-like phospholipase family protein [Desulfacinum hydrothermale]SMC22966.1 NTE family protein [Desulfacinum hydrothermale DSM 13146]
MSRQLHGLPKPVAFVFSGGVSLGAAQVGMLRAVLEAGIRPDLLVGSSAGALNAAFVAKDISLARVEELARIWQNLKKEDVFGRPTLRRAFHLLFRRISPVSCEAMEQLIAAHAPASYERLQAALVVVATNYFTGQTELFTSGDLRRHLLASTAIPVVFPPVSIGSALYVDGSVSAHVPLLPAPCPQQVPAYDFSHRQELVRMGFDAAAGFLAQTRLSGPGVYGAPHSHGEAP